MRSLKEGTTYATRKHMASVMSQNPKCTSERPKYTSERPSGGSGADGWQTSQQAINQFNGACHVCGHKWRWLQT